MGFFKKNILTHCGLSGHCPQWRRINADYCHRAGEGIIHYHHRPQHCQEPPHRLRQKRHGRKRGSEVHRVWLVLCPPAHFGVSQEAFAGGQLFMVHPPSEGLSQWKWLLLEEDVVVAYVPWDPSLCWVQFGND